MVAKNSVFLVESLQIQILHRLFNGVANYQINNEPLGNFVLEFFVGEWNQLETFPQFYTVDEDAAKGHSTHHEEHVAQFGVLPDVLSEGSAEVVHENDRCLEPPLINKHH